MEHISVEILSASLVREYLARKKLARTLKLLDEEQAEHSSCIRNRLRLLKALHIGKLIKRNKELGYPLDSMVEVIVQFLVDHARVSRKSKNQEDIENEKLQEKLPFGKELVVDSLEVNFEDKYIDTHINVKESQVYMVQNKDSGTDYDNAIKDKETDANKHILLISGNCCITESVKDLDVEKSKDLTNCNLQQENEDNDSEDRVMQVVDAVREELNSSILVGDDEVNQNYDSSSLSHANDDASITSTTSSYSTSGSESSSSESESEASAASIIDLLKQQEGQGDSRLQDTKNLTFKVPSDVNLFRSLEDLEDDVEIISAGEGDFEPQMRISCNNSQEDEEELDEDAFANFCEEEEVVSGRPSHLGLDSPPRPGTQESTRHTPSHNHLLWLQPTGDPRDAGEDGGGRGGGRSPPVMKITTQVPNFRPGGIFDHAVDSFRPHINGFEMKNGLQAPVKAHSNGHIPNGMSNGFMNGHSVRNGSVQNGVVPNGIQGRRGNSIFDVDADVDIATMAAQRDQLRGARHSRGMMAPVMSKTEESHTRSATRRLQMSKRSESGLGGHELGGVIEENMFPLQEQRDRENRSVLGTAARRRRLISDIRDQRGGVLGGLEGVGFRSPADYLMDPERRGDIMAQSMRRQSLRGSKQSLMEGNYGNFESAASSRLSMETDSANEFAIYKDDEEEVSTEKKVKNVPKFIPNSHEDIQILNLQGFMDASSFSGEGGGTGKRKHKKKKGKRVNEDGSIDKAKDASYKYGSKPRRKRNHRHSKGNLSDDDGELVLKDIDDLDNKVAGLVLGPKPTNKDSVGRPITLEEASDLKNILMGSPAQSMPNEWMIQNFKQNSNANLSYGLVQKKGGPCGVLACVQAYMMKCLIFGSAVAPSTSPISPLRPSNREWSWALSAAITEILWKAGQEQKAILALPGSFPHFSDQGVGRYSRDGVTETLTLHEYVEVHQLHDAISSHLSVFINESGSGCVVLLFSALFSRGIENVITDMDAGGGHLINSHGYASQEIVNLLITGRATTNTFNGEQTFGTSPTQMVVLHGIQHKSEIGFLSLYEHYDCYKVGPYLKSPQFPIWVVCCESHFSVIFSRDTLVTADSPSVSKFDIYYYDGLALQEDEIRLTIDLDGEEPDITVVPPLEHCIRTKWNRASVEWNGADPIL